MENGNSGYCTRSKAKRARLEYERDSDDSFDCDYCVPSYKFPIRKSCAFASVQDPSKKTPRSSRTPFLSVPPRRQQTKAEQPKCKEKSKVTNVEPDPMFVIPFLEASNPPPNVRPLSTRLEILKQTLSSLDDSTCVTIWDLLDRPDPKSNNLSQPVEKH